MWHTRRTNRRPAINPYKRHRFPTGIIGHAVWLSFRFCLSDRDVEELMAERGVTLTYEAVRYGCRKFGQVMRISCAAGTPDSAISGIWMRSF